MVPCGMWPVRVDQDPLRRVPHTYDHRMCRARWRLGPAPGWYLVVQHKIKNTMKHTLNYKAGIHIQEPTT